SWRWMTLSGTPSFAISTACANRDYERIARQILGEADEVDRDEDARHGQARGDELPPELASREGRERWLRGARRDLDEQRAVEARPIPRSRQDRLKEAKRRLQEELAVECAANAAYEHYRAHGRQKNGRRLWPPPKPYTPPDIPQGKINLTDLDSRNVKTRGGYLQGYNAQAAVTATQIVIAAEISVSSPDFGLLGPVMDAALSELEAVGVTDTPGVLVADTGYWHQVQMDQIVEHGTHVLIPPDAGNRKTPRPGWDGGLYAFMRGVLQTKLGGDLYRKRKGMIEPVFGNTKFNRGIDRFQRRGRSAVRSEWRLITATHNLMKLHTHQLAITAP
ncbi:MAG: transposase, partial [Actinobacteria bacterium]|nr:transposase [Actinomycetota bacterium]